MKAIKAATGLIMAIVFLVAGALPALAAETSDTFVLKSAQLYPVIATDEWGDMSRADRVAACQITEEDALDMSTEDLFQYVLNYPFMIDIYAFSTLEKGFEHVYNEFEAISWLVNRDNYGQVLIDTYSSISVENNTLGRNSDCYQNIWELGILEILIAQPEMTDSLSSDEIADLVELAKNKLTAKSSTLDIYSGSCASFAQALSENPNSAITLAATYYVKTPAGTSVEVYNYSDIVDWTSTEKAILNAQTLTSYPTATLLQDASKKYNCHSYAWYSSSSLNHYWMDDPTAYMTDGSYYETSRKIDNIAYWYDTFNGITVPIHSGIVQEHMQSGVFVGARSKWGQLGAYNHKFDDCPYSGSGTISYWTKS